MDNNEILDDNFFSELLEDDETLELLDFALLEDESFLELDDFSLLEEDSNPYESSSLGIVGVEHAAKKTAVKTARNNLKNVLFIREIYILRRTFAIFQQNKEQKVTGNLALRSNTNLIPQREPKATDLKPQNHYLSWILTNSHNSTS